MFRKQRSLSVDQQLMVLPASDVPHANSPAVQGGNHHWQASTTAKVQDGADVALLDYAKERKAFHALCG